MTIATFLTADGRDDAGRTHADILAADNRFLESRHDFIQWLFPLQEPSRAVPGSPVLDRATIAALRISPAAQERLGAAAERMLAFYGATSAWRTAFDHNHLRITRVIKSLRLLAGDTAAEDFKRRILALAGGAPIDARARDFWNAA